MSLISQMALSNLLFSLLSSGLIPYVKVDDVCVLVSCPWRQMLKTPTMIKSNGLILRAYGVPSIMSESLSSVQYRGPME